MPINTHKKNRKRPHKFIYNLVNTIYLLRDKLSLLPKYDLVIVTGANHLFFKQLLNLIASITKYEPTSEIWFYDLGLTTEQHFELIQKYPKVKYIKFDFSKYPPYFNININAGQYAWKPIIIKDVARQTSKKVLWLDSACQIISPLYWIRRTIDKYGLYCPVASMSKSNGDLTCPETIEVLGGKDFAREPMLAAGTVGFNPLDRFGNSILSAWADYAMQENVISPQNSSRENHRQDQSILSLLIYSSGIAYKLPQRYCGIKVHIKPI